MVDSRQQPPEASVDPGPAGAAGPQRRALGRGLAALIPGVAADEPGIVELPVDRIRPNSLQPRAGFGEEPLAELQASIREHGVLQPVLVRPAGAGYELVAGERRWRAASAAGLRTVPAIVRRLDDRGALEAALVENLQREDLNPLERARAYSRLKEGFGLNQEEIARRVGRSQPSVANTLRLLSLPAEVQVSLEGGRISEGHARALLGAPSVPQMMAIWRAVELKGLSVRATEEAVRRAGISRGIGRARDRRDRDIYIIEQSLTERLGAPVRIHARKGGAGEIRISFATGEDLQRLLEALAPRGAGRR